MPLRGCVVKRDNRAGRGAQGRGAGGATQERRGRAQQDRSVGGEMGMEYDWERV